MSRTPIHVQLTLRSPGQFRSVEELFYTIASAFPRNVKSWVTCAPSGRASLGSIVSNLSWSASLQDCDLIHQTGDIHYTVLSVWRLPVVLTIHDLRFIEEARGIKRLLFWWWWLYLPCLRANRVTVISEFTRQRLLAFCRVNPNKVRVIPNCVAPEFSPLEKPWPVSAHRMLVVGTTPNKNLERVIAASAGLDVMLSILGCLSEEQRQLLDQTGLKFEEHSGLSRAEVVGLYQSCDLVCFVSTYEGFGMPILEAQAVGRPVITSDISPMREVAGEGALLVNPFDTHAIRSGLIRIFSEPVLRETLVSKGFENVKQYSAESIAAKYAAIYHELVDK